MNTAALMALAHDLPAVWNTPGADARAKQRITHILMREVIFELDDAANEAVVTIHWTGGRHTELRVARVRSGRYPEGRGANPVDAIRKMSGLWPDREIAVTLNHMRCKPADGKAWTTVRVRDMRDQLGVPTFCPSADDEATISAERAAARLGICVGSVQKPIREGALRQPRSCHRRHGGYQSLHSPPKTSSKACRQSSAGVQATTA